MTEQFFVEEKECSADNMEQARYLLQSEFPLNKEAIALSTIKVDEGYRICWNGEWHPMTSWTLKSLLRMLRIPETFGRRIPRDLLAENIERLKQIAPLAVIVFLRNNDVINIVEDGYDPPKSQDILSILQKYPDRWQPERIRLSDRGMWLTLVNQDLPVIEPVVGDMTKVALSLVNSETGATALRCSYSTYRLACLNGALVRDEWGSLRWNYDQRVKYASRLSEFEAALLGLSFSAASLIELYSRLPDEQLSDEEIVELWRAIARVLGPTQADSILKISDKERREITKTVRDRWSRNRTSLPGDREKPASTEFIAYDVFNEVTAAARDAAYPIARQLERIGGRLIEVAARR